MAEADTKLSRVLPPTNGGLFFALILGLFLYERPYQLLRDGGIARHIITGQYLLQHGNLPTTNHITALWSQSAWATNSVLSDTIFGAVFNTLGHNGIVLIAALCIGLSLTWSYQMARSRGMPALVGMALTIMGMFVMSLHWSARPHAFTYLPFLLTYYVLFVWNGTQRAQVIIVAVTMLIWANLHGSFYLGIGMVFCKLLGDLITDRQSWRQNLVIVITALVACCINFSGGANFLTYIFSYFGHVTMKITNDEWRSIDFGLGPRIWLFVLLVIGQLGIWIYSPKKPTASEALYNAGLILFGIYSMRMIPYFALLMPIATAPSMAAIGTIPIDERISKSEPTSLKAAGAWIVVTAVLSIAWMVLPQFKLHDFDPGSMPVECAEKLKSLPQNSFGFTRDNWAAYLYLKAHQPIFIDDYHNYYPPEAIEDYRRIYYTEPGWKQLIDKYKFDWVVVPSDMQLQLYLRESGEWTLVCADKTAALLERKITR